MADLKSVEQIKAYYEFCINMEIIAWHNARGNMNTYAHQKAIDYVCEYLNMDPIDFLRDNQPNTEEDLSWWMGAGNAISWVLENIIKEEYELCTL